MLGFVSALFSAFAYYKQTKKGFHNTEDLSWRSLGRLGYIVHGVSIMGLIGLIFYIMIAKMYEYNYVFDHVSDDLPMRYIFSAFWEGQEGSFLLWMFWHIIFGIGLMFTAKKWESSVVMFFAIIEAVLVSMILGIHFEVGDFVYKMGSNPVMLVRDTFMNAPLFQQADYLSMLKGDGLNPLLQNYWMTIHPPTLFAGFASTTVPFAFAAAGFFTKETKAWIKPALRWALFSAGMLGMGILMGGAWAYEALTFGGYWAWDPVENMSFVPWLILVAGVHANLIANSTGRAVKSTYIYYTLSFVLVLYSTYMTRSGVLGDTSAHAFTEMGLEPQLMFLVLFPAFIVTALYFARAKYVPKHEKEESSYSREFWMFVGALILLFAGLIIAASTSLPVLNSIIRIWDPGFQGSVINDPIPHYNKFQIWTSIFVTVLTAKTVFLRYKAGKWNGKQKTRFALKQLAFFGAAILMTFLLSLWLDYYHWKYTLLTLCCSYAIIANFAFLFQNIKAVPGVIGSVCGHVGFGVMILGTISSGLNESVITEEPFATQGLVNGQGEDFAENVILIKEEPFFVNNYWITYESDTTIEKTRTFKLKFEKQEAEASKADPFYVYPNVLYTNDLQKIAATNPDTRHYLHKDIFVQIASLPPAQQDVELARMQEDSLKYEKYHLNIGDTIYTKDKYGIVEYVNFNPKSKDFKQSDSDLGLAVGVRFLSLDGTYNKLIEPTVALKENMLYQYPDQVDELGVKIKLNEETFDNYFTQENELNYETFRLTTNDVFTHEGTEYVLRGFNKQIDNPNYTEQEGDIPISAVIQVKDDPSIEINPVYIIRNQKPFSIKDYDPISGTHVRLSHIDPIKELFIFQMGKDKRDNDKVVLEVAENVPRTDIIVVKAQVFPGINLFWLGSCTMLLGFFLAYWNRYKTTHA